MGFKNLDEMKK